MTGNGLGNDTPFWETVDPQNSPYCFPFASSNRLPCPVSTSIFRPRQPQFLPFSGNNTPLFCPPWKRYAPSDILPFSPSSTFILRSRYLRRPWTFLLFGWLSGLPAALAAWHFPRRVSRRRRRKHPEKPTYDHCQYRYFQKSYKI